MKNKEPRTMMDTEIDNIKRFADMVEGSIDIIKKLIYDDFQFTEEFPTGMKGSWPQNGYILRVTVSLPLSIKITVERNGHESVSDEPFLYMENAYGTMTRKVNDTELLKYNLVDFEKAITEYWHNWYTNTWTKPYDD